MNGTYIVPYGQAFPYLGEVKWGRDPEGEIKAVVVKEIVALKWLQNGIHEKESVFPGTVQEKTRQKSQKGSIG